MPDTPVSLLERLRHSPTGPAWRQWVELYTPFIRARIAGQGTPAADVDDLAQEVLAVLVQELPRFEHNGRPGAFRCWLRGVVVNRLRNYWRAQAGPLEQNGSAWEGVLRQLEDAESGLSQAWDREHDEFIFARLMKMLEGEFEPVTWQAFRLKVLENRPTAEVAAALGITANAVRIAKSRVLSRFRQEAAGLVE